MCPHTGFLTVTARNYPDLCSWSSISPAGGYIDTTTRGLTIEYEKLATPSFGVIV